MIKFIKDIRNMKAKGAEMRPWLQIIIIFPLFLLYYLADRFVSWYDKNF